MSGNRAIEWRHFWAFYNGKGRFTVKPLQQMRGDLFNVDDDFSLAHCVSSDLKMSQGIALQFRCRFGRLRELRNQNKIPGEMAYLRHGDKFIYYLVTKHRYFQKPSYKNIWQCLWYMKEHIVCNGVRRLGLPKIACGRDGKDWGIIKSMIEFIFRDVPCDIFVVY